MSDIIKQRLRLINAVGTAAIVTLFAGTVAFGVVPMVRAGKRDVQQASELARQLEDLNSLSIKLARAEVDRSSDEARLKVAEALLPSANGMNQFVQELAKTAEDAGLQVDGVIPSRDLKDAGAYKRMSVQISGRGDWDTCYRFLTGLRGANRKLTRLENISIQAANAGERTGHCKIDVQVSTLIAR